MQKKTIGGWVLMLIVCLGFMIQGSQQAWTQAGYQSLLSFYGTVFSAQVPVNFVYNPGLRGIGVDPDEIKIYTIPPHTGRTYQQEMDDFLKSDANILIECSGMDTWHSSPNGSRYLSKMSNRAYRVVIFDGGHHLPTLGLAPDVLIVPVMKGYAVHGYMKDGIKVQTMVELMKQCDSKTILVTVPRWRLVKNESCLSRVCEQVFQKLSVNPDVHETVEIQCQPRISRRNGQIFIYVNSEYIKKPKLLVNYCKKLPFESKDQIYIAFDYSSVRENSAPQFANSLQQELGLKVTVVNEAVKVSDLLWMSGNEK